MANPASLPITVLLTVLHVAAGTSLAANFPPWNVDDDRAADMNLPIFRSCKNDLEQYVSQNDGKVEMATYWLSRDWDYVLRASGTIKPLAQDPGRFRYICWTAGEGGVQLSLSPIHGSDQDK